MSTTKVLRHASDAWIQEDDANSNHGGSGYLNLQAGGGVRRRSFVFFPNVVLDGVTVLSATLYHHLESTGWAGGPHTVTVSRVTQRFKEHGVNWTNQPTISTTHQGTLAAAGADGAEVAIDLTQLFSDVAGGSTYFGLRLEVDTVGLKQLSSAQSIKPGRKPRLEITYVHTPDPPHDLRPSGGLAVSNPSPKLAWTTHVNQQAFQVKIASDSGMTSITHDSGTVVDDRSHYDLNDVGVVIGSTLRYWKIRIQNENGIWSDYSDVVSFNYLSPGVLTLVSPTDPAYETTPPVDWTFTGRTQKSFDIWLFEGSEDAASGWGDDWGGMYGGEGYREIWHMGRTKASYTHAKIPPHLIRRVLSNKYKLRLRVWDTEGRVGTVGSQVYVQTELIFTFQEDPTLNAVANLTVVAQQFYVLISWTDASQADYYGIAIDRDGDGNFKYIFDRIAGYEAYVGPTNNYAKKFYHATPLVNHTYKVVRIVKDGAGKYKHSKNNPTQALTFIPTGIWLVDYEEKEDAINVRGDGAKLSLAIGESSTTYYPLNSREAVRFVDAIRGYEGTVTGVLKGRADKDVLEEFKGSLPNKRFRLITGDMSIPVKLGVVSELEVTGDPSDTASGKLWQVTFEILQQDDWTFRYRY